MVNVDIFSSISFKLSLITFYVFWGFDNSAIALFASSNVIIDFFTYNKYLENSICLIYKILINFTNKMYLITDKLMKLIWLSLCESYNEHWNNIDSYYMSYFYMSNICFLFFLLAHLYGTTIYWLSILQHFVSLSF